MTSVSIISFGYLHGAPPEAHLTADLRPHFKDRHADPALRQMTALDEPVMAAVLATPGIQELADALQYAVQAFLCGPSDAPVTVAIGCAGGRHRSAAVAISMARLLQVEGIPVTVTHRDLDKPVVERPETVA